jgi:hypothetical protein
VLACRSPGRGEELAASLRAEAAAAGAPPPSLEVASLDLSSLDSVRAFAAAWDKRADGRPLGALVNNAGIFDMGSSAPGRDDRGHEAHWGTNYLVRVLASCTHRRHPFHKCCGAGAHVADPADAAGAAA